jgi:hypothetical protein
MTEIFLYGTYGNLIRENAQGLALFYDTLLTLESVKTKTKTSRGYESSCVFKEVIVLFVL